MFRKNPNSQAARLRHQLSRRGAFLMFLALLDFVYAYSLFNPTPTSINNPTSMFLQTVGGLAFWGALWLTAGIFAFVFAFRQKDAPGFAACMFIKILWSLLFLMAWLFADVERAYLSTVIWGAFAAVLALVASWPEEVRGNKLDER